MKHKHKYSYYTHPFYITNVDSKVLVRECKCGILESTYFDKNMKFKDIRYWQKGDEGIGNLLIDPRKYER